MTHAFHAYAWALFKSVEIAKSKLIIASILFDKNYEKTFSITQKLCQAVWVKNLDVSDNIIGLNRGASSNANDSGFIIERGSTGDNAAFLWDETADKFVFGTTTGTPASTRKVRTETKQKGPKRTCEMRNRRGRKGTEGHTQSTERNIATPSTVHYPAPFGRLHSGLSRPSARMAQIARDLEGCR